MEPQQVHRHYSVIPDGFLIRFVIDPSDAGKVANASNLSILQLFPALVKCAKDLARPPISKYPVGAVGIGSSGRIFLGVNLEFPGLPLHQSVHAEQFLVTNMAINSEPHLRYIAVSSAPCGHCRQFLQEIREASNIQILITSSDETKNNYHGDEAKSLSRILPDRFGPDDLLGKEVPLLLEPHHNGLGLSRKDHEFDNGDGDANGVVCSDGIDKFEKLVKEALLAANKSHAPYSSCPSGVGLIDDEGKIYSGSYMESAAYNPSLGPVQAALVAYVAGDGGEYDKIVGGVLVEKRDDVIKQEHTARMLLQTISPRCEFRVVHCHSGLSVLKNLCE